MAWELLYGLPPLAVSYYTALMEPLRVVVIDDSNRTCGMAAEIIATAAEEMHLLTPPRRITRPDGAILGFAPELDLTLQPGRQQLADMVLEVIKAA